MGMSVQWKAKGHTAYIATSYSMISSSKFQLWKWECVSKMQIAVFFLSFTKLHSAILKASIFKR